MDSQMSSTARLLWFQTPCSWHLMAATDWKHLENTIHQRWGCHAQIRCTYVDEDGDTIGLQCEDDLDEAIREVACSLNLHVTVSQTTLELTEPMPRPTAYCQRFTALSGSPTHVSSSLDTVPQKIRGQIERDVARTLPEHPLFVESSQHGLDSLTRVLTSVAASIPEVGYCQGLNFVAAYALLLVKQSEGGTGEGCDGGSLALQDGRFTAKQEVRATQLTLGLIEHAVPRAFYSDDQSHSLPMLAGMIGSAYAVDDLMASMPPHGAPPGLLAHLNELGLPPNFFAVRWLPRLFVGILPLEIVAWAWDLLVEHGPDALLALTAGLLSLHGSMLLECSDNEQACKTMDQACRDLDTIDALERTVGAFLHQLTETPCDVHRVFHDRFGFPDLDAEDRRDAESTSESAQDHDDLERQSQWSEVFEELPIDELPSQEEEEECSICLEEMEREEVVRLGCRHAFHAECIADWLDRHSEECPMCRASIFATPTPPAQPSIEEDWVVDDMAVDTPSAQVEESPSSRLFSQAGSPATVLDLVEWLSSGSAINVGGLLSTPRRTRGRAWRSTSRRAKRARARSASQHAAQQSTPRSVRKEESRSKDLPLVARPVAGPVLNTTVVIDRSVATGEHNIHLAAGSAVKLTDSSNPMVNGKEGVLGRYDERRNRYQVDLEMKPGVVTKVLVRAEVVALVERTEDVHASEAMVCAGAPREANRTVTSERSAGIDLDSTSKEEAEAVRQAKELKRVMHSLQQAGFL